MDRRWHSSWVAWPIGKYEQRQSHDIARGSALECGAIRDVSGLMGYATQNKSTRESGFLVESSRCSLVCAGNHVHSSGPSPSPSPCTSPCTSTSTSTSTSMGARGRHNENYTVDVTM